MAFSHPDCINSLFLSANNHRSVTSKSPIRFSVTSRRRKTLSITNLAASMESEAYVNGFASTSRSLSEKKALKVSPSSSSAMEQLDIERGVCVPFRKYSPETV